jgi:tRNA (cytidine/uridine-2'-O-)-methyltransferase
VSDLSAHSLSVALIRPQIPQNVGNIARTCVASGTALHLAGPLGFVLDDRKLRRSGLDYWPRLNLHLHPSEEHLLTAIPAERRWFFDSSGSRPLFDTLFTDGDTLIFGSETLGLPQETLAGSRDQVIRIPQSPGERCLNLATSVGIGLYIALRSIS